MNVSMEFSRKLALAYSMACKPLCPQLKLPQTAFDILMFLANNPAYQTAADIVEIRKIKANLVSVNVEKLVRDGYLTRRAIISDRRKTQPVIEKGRALQSAFLDRLFVNTDEDMHHAFFETVGIMNRNLDSLLKGEFPL